MNRRRRVFGWTLGLSLGLVAAGAVLWTLAARRPVHRVVSPDGVRVAFVRAAPALDGPSQSLWLGSEATGDSVLLARLAPDMDWCDGIFWSVDGHQVGFLIRGFRVDVYDAAREKLVRSWRLIEPDGYPGSLEARGVGFSPDGLGLRFVVCRRGGEPCSAEREIRFGPTS